MTANVFQHACRSFGTAGNRWSGGLSGVAVLMVWALALAAMAGGPHASHSAPASAPAKSPTAVRVGTFDSRAVTVAYVRSADSAKAMQALLAERAAADKAGDRKRVAELNQQGESLQVRRHLQGFSNAPVDDILDSIRDELPGVAKRAKVSVIVSAAAWCDASVELVDVTDDLVRLFNPDAQTLKVVAEVRRTEPIAIEATARIPARN